MSWRLLFSSLSHIQSCVSGHVEIRALTEATPSASMLMGRSHEATMSFSNLLGDHEPVLGVRVV